MRTTLQRSAYIAGGTELNSRNDLSVSHLISLENLDLDIIQKTGESLFIGATVTLQQIVDAEEIRLDPWRSIGSAASMVANRNIRNQATLGGNLASNKSCSDLIPVLQILKAQCQVQEEADLGYSPLDDYLDLPYGEKPLLLGVKLSKPPAGLKIALKRFSRTANDIAIVNLALAARPVEGRLEDVRIALGGLAPRVVRAALVEKTLEGFPAAAPLDDLAKTASQALLESIAPIDDIRGSASFKTRVAGALLIEALREITSPGGAN